MLTYDLGSFHFTYTKHIFYIKIWNILKGLTKCSFEDEIQKGKVTILVEIAYI